MHISLEDLRLEKPYVVYPAKECYPNAQAGGGNTTHRKLKGPEVQ
jgi:hypothetical protein